MPASADASPKSSATSQLLRIGSTRYPDALVRYLGERAPAAISALGNLDILAKGAIALFCSVRCPGNVILEAYELARALREAGRTVIGGFHSPMEKECLRLLLGGRQPVIICPARGIETMRLPVDWQSPVADGRVLVLSSFGEGQRRITADLAQKRNEFVAALADEVFVAHAEPGGKTEAFAQTVVRWGKPLLAVESPSTTNLVTLGARIVKPRDFR